MRPLIALCLAILALPAAAGDTSPHQVYESLQDLHQVGTRLQRQYDDQDLAQLKACAAEARPHRDQAKALQKKVRDPSAIKSAAARLALVFPADDAMSCLWCLNGLEECRKLEKSLGEAKARLDELARSREAAESDQQPVKKSERWPGHPANQADADESPRLFMAP